MKKLIAITLAALMLLCAFVACDSTTPEAATTEQSTKAPTEAPTEAPTVPNTSETESETEATTEEPTTATEADTDEEETTLNELGHPYEILEVPVGYSGNTTLRGYCAQGAFYYDEDLNCLYSDSDNNMLVVTNDTMSAGTLSATFLSAPGYINDNGIVFGMEESLEDEYYFWEFGPAYYFLFISDAERLYLAKAGFNGQAWTELYVTDEPVTNYAHGETNITITVEFDGQGTIKCYANGELLIDYFDENPIQGNRYGVRCEVFGVEYYNIQAIHD